MVLIVYHHMLQEDDAYHSILFFSTACVKRHKPCSVLGRCSQYLLCNHYIKCSDCLLEINITEWSAISECVQCIARSSGWFSVSFTPTISRCYQEGERMDQFHSDCLWPLQHCNKFQVLAVLSCFYLWKLLGHHLKNCIIFRCTSWRCQIKTPLCLEQVNSI